MSSIRAIPAAAPDASTLARWLNSPLLLPVICALAVFARTLFDPQAQEDGDTFWHIRTGQWIWQHGQVPATDIFSHSMPGAPWTAHEWLSELVMALAWNGAGITGVLLLNALATAAMVLVITLYAARYVGPVGQMLMALMALPMLAPGFVARPHIFGLLLLALWLTALLDARTASKSPSVYWLPLMAIWANMHASFVMGLALVGLFGLEALMEAPARLRWQTMLRWVLFGLGSLAMALLTPHGVEGVLYPFRVMGMRSLVLITEWNPVDFSQHQPVEVAMMAVFFFAVQYRLRLPLLRLLLLLGVLHMTLQHVRQELLLAVIGVVILAPAIAQGLADLRRERPATPLRLRMDHLGLLGALVMVLIAAMRLWQPAVVVESSIKPVSALAAVPASLRARPVLNGYGTGGYLILNNIKPFIDGRSDMYGDAFVIDFGKLQALDPAFVEGQLQKYSIDWTIFEPGNALNRHFAAKAGWHVLHQDKFAVVYARDGV